MGDLVKTVNIASNVETARLDLSREVKKVHTGDPRSFMNGIGERFRSEFVRSSQYGNVHYDEIATSMKKQLDTFGTAIEYSKDG